MRLTIDWAVRMPSRSERRRSLMLKVSSRSMLGTDLCMGKRLLTNFHISCI